MPFAQSPPDHSYPHESNPPRLPAQAPRPEDSPPHPMLMSAPPPSLRRSRDKQTATKPHLLYRLPRVFPGIRQRRLGFDFPKHSTLALAAWPCLRHHGPALAILTDSIHKRTQRSPRRGRHPIGHSASFTSAWIRASPTAPGFPPLTSPDQRSPPSRPFLPNCWEAKWSSLRRVRLLPGFDTL
jgi:hypothetical protein